jgi:predicted TIM-barrel fold metal-dependent hydrolase
MELKIFDTLVHSGINLNWPSKPNVNVNLYEILDLIDDEKILKGALVQTSPWFDSSNSLELFYKIIISHQSKKRVLPVATIPNFNLSQAKLFIDNAIEIGFSIFKIHPRFSHHNQNELINILDYLLPKAKLVQVCTYQNKEIIQETDSLIKSDLIGLLAYKSNYFKKNIMLMHGGDVSIMETHSFVRHNKYLILDLSMTILKYDGSSIDDDLKFLFRNFDQRICIGSDYPEWNYQKLEKKLLILSENVPEDKLKNIYYNNVENIFCD